MPPRYLLFAFCFKIRGLLVVILLFVMFFTTYAQSRHTLLNWAIGLPPFLAAFLLRIRSQQYLRYRLREEGALATTGPYAHVRNPVYIANSTGLAALSILCGLYWMAPIAFAWAILVYHLSVQFEEMRLLKRFGEPYRRFLDSVPRWIPSRSPRLDAGSGRAGFWTAARVEWQNALLLLVPLGKAWVYRSEPGRAHQIARQFASLVARHGDLLAILLGVGILVLAAWNLNHLRALRRRRAQREGN